VRRAAAAGITGATARGGQCGKGRAPEPPPRSSACLGSVQVSAALTRFRLRAGLRELADAEPRFEPFGRSLFGPAALGLERAQRSAEENARLDALLAGFLQLLAGFFLAPAATKALEFLVRQYRRAASGRARPSCLRAAAVLACPCLSSCLTVYMRALASEAPTQA